MKSRMSIMGLYQYDNSIFNDMILPEGIDKEDVVNNLLIELDELEILYPKPETMKLVIGIWSNKELKVWQKLYDTTILDYNPIWNKDSYVENSNTETRNLQNINTETMNLQDVNTETRNLTGTNNGSATATNTGSDITKNYVFGYNETGKAQQNESEVLLGSGNTSTNNNSATDSGTITNSGNNSGTIGNNENNTGTIGNEYNSREYGNIGVTTTQQMIKQERDIDKFNIIDYIINSFKQRFCIQIW